MQQRPIALLSQKRKCWQPREVVEERVVRGDVEREAAARGTGVGRCDHFSFQEKPAWN